MVRFGLSLIALVMTLATARAGIVWTLDGRVLEGELKINGDGTLRLNADDSQSATFQWREIASATFAPGSFFSSGSVLPNGWTASDLGEVRGRARLDTNTFLLHVDSNTTNATAAHYVFRTMASDGDVYVRVDSIQSTAPGNAGVMIRGHGASVFAALSVDNEGRITFVRRSDSEKKEIRSITGPRVQTPVWLCLRKSGKTVKAMYGQTPQSLETLATESIKLTYEKTWRDAEGELEILKATCGVFVSSHGVGSKADARVTLGVLFQHGVIGEYFADRDFGNLKFARIDPQIRFNWREDAPDQSLDKDSFSVRWSGKLVAPKSGSYSFHYDGEGSARLWLNNEEVQLGSFKRGSPVTPRPLLRGSPVEFRFEFIEDEGPASAKLGWAFAGKEPEVIAMTNFMLHFSGAKSPESIALARSTNSGPAVRGVLLRNGTFLAGHITKADQSAIRVAYLGRKDATILNNRVARVFLKPPRQQLDYQVAKGRNGVFMKNGDFFEADLHSFEYNSLTMSSVLFGLKRFWTEGNSDPLVVIVNDVVEPKSGFEVRLIDGSVLRAEKFTAQPESIEVEESILGSITVPFADLVEVRKLGVVVAEAAK